MEQIIKVSKQTIWQILGKLVSSLSTIIILGIVSRNYGEEGTGVFTLALTYLAIFYLLADFGFNAHVLRKSTVYSLQSTVEWQRLLGTRIAWSVALVIIAVELLPFWPFTTPEFSQAILYGSLAIIGSAVFITCNLIFQSRLRYDLSVLASAFGTIISLGVFVYFGLLKIPVPNLLLAHLLSWILIASCSLSLVKRFVPKLSPIFDLSYAKSLFKDTWAIAATLALNVVYFRADSFMIAYFKGVSDVGIYNLAYSIFQSALVLPAFIMNAYYPLMLKSLSKVKLVAAGLLTLALVSMVSVLKLAPFLIKLLTGGGFSGSAESLQILALGFPAYFLSSLLMWLLVTKGRYKLMLAIYTFGLIVNLILNLIYIPQSSFMAAATITVVSEYLILMVQIMVLWWAR